MEIRGYSQGADFEPVGRMLSAAYRPGRVFDPWLQPRWEYMHFHPLIRDQDLGRCGVAEERGDIVGVVHVEHDPAVAYLQRRPGADHVIGPLLDWAERHLGGPSEEFGGHMLGIYVPDFDVVLRRAAQERGYVEHPAHREPQSRLGDIDLLEPPVPPGGYTIRSLADDNDLAQVDRVLWRGFDHEGPSPEGGIEDRRFMQSAPNFRPDLTIVAVDGAGAYAALCGMWVVPEIRLAYVEPVATDPDHRRRGLGRAVVIEATRRAAAAGADVAWVGSDQPFYRSFGFEVMFASTLWVRGGSG